MMAEPVGVQDYVNMRTSRFLAEDMEQACTQTCMRAVACVLWLTVWGRCGSTRRGQGGSMTRSRSPP